jgi:hypothetical protein
MPIELVRDAAIYCLVMSVYCFVGSRIVLSENRTLRLIGLYTGQVLVTGIILFITYAVIRYF